MSATLTQLELPPIITAGDTSYATHPYLASEDIQAKVAEMGQALAEHYAPMGSVHMLTVLQGAVPFAHDLRRSMGAARPDLRITTDEIGVSSYVGTESRDLHFYKSPSQELAGENVLIVEDIFDTGKTLDRLTAYIHKCRPASVEVAVALNKDVPKVTSEALGNVAAMHAGFEIPNRFVIGYGLDLDGDYRELQGIYALTELTGEA